MSYPHIAAPIAAVHTLFNVITTVLFLPFSKQFARLVEYVIKADAAEKPHLSALKMTPWLSPIIACDQVLLEVQFMRDSDLELLAGVKDVLTGNASERAEAHILHREDVLDNVQREVTEFLGRVIVKRSPTDVALRVKRLMRLSDELESVSDEAADIVKAARRLRKGGQNFSDVSLKALLSVHNRVMPFAHGISEYVKSPRPEFNLLAIQTESGKLATCIRATRQGQLNRVGPDDPTSPLRVLAELDILNAYDRIRSCYLNIAETLAGGKTAT